MSVLLLEGFGGRSVYTGTGFLGKSRTAGTHVLPWLAKLTLPLLTTNDDHRGQIESGDI